MRTMALCTEILDNFFVSESNHLIEEEVVTRKDISMPALN
jgi:hypothetical protein